MTEPLHAISIMQPIRLAPRLHPETGVALPPAYAGRWHADPDGGYTPLDESTALAAGLQWTAEPQPNPQE